MNRFSDRGSTPLVSSPEGRAAKLGLLEFEKYCNPTTVKFVHCLEYFITEGRAAKLGLFEVENDDPTTVALIRCVECYITIQEVDPLPLVSAAGDRLYFL